MPIPDSNAKGITCEAPSVLGQTTVTDQIPMNMKFVYVDEDGFSHIPINRKRCIINPSINSPTPNGNRYAALSSDSEDGKISVKQRTSQIFTAPIPTSKVRRNKRKKTAKRDDEFYKKKL